MTRKFQDIAALIYKPGYGGWTDRHMICCILLQVIRTKSIKITPHPQKEDRERERDSSLSLSLSLLLLSWYCPVPLGVRTRHARPTCR